MSSADVATWVAAEPWRLVEAPLDVHFPVVLCTVCLEPPDTAPDGCAGPPPDDDASHLWQATFTAAVPDADARRWDDDEGLAAEYVHAVAVTCLLCGQSAAGAPAACPERVADPADDTPLTVADIVSTGPADEDRTPRYKLASDADGDLHIVALPDEPDAEDWRVFERRRDGTTREVEQTPFWSTGLGPLEDRPSWFVGNGFTVEIHVPGRDPYVVTGGRFLRDLPEGTTRPGWGSWEVDEP